MGNRISGSFSTCEIALDDEKLKRFLQEHLGHILMEPDFDAIATQIQRQIESLLVLASSQSLDPEPSPASTNVTARVPTEALKELFQSQLAEGNPLYNNVECHVIQSTQNRYTFSQ